MTKLPAEFAFWLNLARVDLTPAFTIDETAVRMGVGPKHVRDLIASGQLRTVLVGSDRRVPAVCILEYYLRAAA